MTTVMDTLVFDRTDEDAARVAYLKEQINGDTATAEELLEWAEDLKGAYNYSDLNRVGEACAFLYKEFTHYGYLVNGFATPKTDWTETDTPATEQMEVYLSNVEALRKVWDTESALPETMDELTIDGANEIERLLTAIYAYMKLLIYSMHRSAEYGFYSGAAFVPTATSDYGRTWAQLDAMDTTWANWNAATWYLLLYGNMKAEGE